MGEKREVSNFRKVFPDFCIFFDSHFCKMSMTALDAMRTKIAEKLKGIERYNPDNVAELERYVSMQADSGNTAAYDLEANLTLLKLYQFNPQCFNEGILCKILLLALTNLPHSDFVRCKCLLTQENLDLPSVSAIQGIATMVEQCEFKKFWICYNSTSQITSMVSGFDDAIRKYVCHVISITYQNILEETLSSFLASRTKTSSTAGSRKTAGPRDRADISRFRIKRNPSRRKRSQRK